MVPATFPERAIVEIALPEQIVWAAFVANTFGVGLTKTVAVIEFPLQLLATGVIVKVTVTAILVVFIKLPLMSPLPLDAIPVTLPELFRVQLYVVPVPVRTIFAIELPEQMV